MAGRAQWSRRLANCWASPKAAARNKGFNSIRRSSFYGLVVWTIPWSQGKTQGISPIPPPFREIRLENLCDSRNLRGKSLRGTRRSWEFFVRAGNYFRLFDRGGENGLKSIRSPRRSTYCALSPQRRPCHARVSGHPAAARRGADGAGQESWMLAVVQVRLALDSRLCGNDNSSYRIEEHRQPGEPNVGIPS
jgi:hypothetical protein